jgi:hypothetical protein
MTCPKCQSQYVEPIVSWTISGLKMTMPQLSMWACLNRVCRHEWPREPTSPVGVSTKDTPSDTQIFTPTCD